MLLSDQDLSRQHYNNNNNNQQDQSCYFQESFIKYLATDQTQNNNNLMKTSTSAILPIRTPTNNGQMIMMDDPAETVSQLLEQSSLILVPP